MRIVLVVLLMVATVIFAVQNATMVTVTILAWRFDASLAVIVAVCFALGAIGGVLISMPRLYRMRAHEKRLRAQLADLGGTDLDDGSAASPSQPSTKVLDKRTGIAAGTADERFQQR